MDRTLPLSELADLFNAAGTGDFPDEESDRLVPADPLTPNHGRSSR